MERSGSAPVHDALASLKLEMTQVRGVLHSAWGSVRAREGLRFATPLVNVRDTAVKPDILELRRPQQPLGSAAPCQPAH